jgi:hypothetical protein
VTSVEQSNPATPGATDTWRRGDTWLLRAVGFFAIAVLIHGADHARRGLDSVGKDVLWAGIAAAALEVIVVVLGCQRHRLAPLAAATAGFSLAAGYLLVHFLPSRPWLSDSFTSATNASALSWFAASLEVVAALTLGIVGVIVLRERGGFDGVGQANPAQRTLAQALRHPIAMAMIFGNFALLVITAVQL